MRDKFHLSSELTPIPAKDRRAFRRFVKARLEAERADAVANLQHSIQTKRLASSAVDYIAMASVARQALAEFNSTGRIDFPPGAELSAAGVLLKHAVWSAQFAWLAARHIPTIARDVPAPKRPARSKIKTVAPDASRTGEHASVEEESRA